MNAATGGPSDRDGWDGADGSGFDGMHDRVPGQGSRTHWTAGGGDTDAAEGAQTAEEWAAEDAEQHQLVRPYTLTRGRTRHAEGAAFDVIAQIIAIDRTGLPEPELVLAAEGPEYQAILDLVLQRPLSVAEVAAGTDLPLGVIRILLGDLLEAELIRVSRPVPTAMLPDTTVLRDVIRGLRAL